MRRRWTLIPALLLALACGIAASAHGATSNTTVTMTVPSSTSITNNCTSSTATTLGVIQPGSAATTATGAGAACAVSFSSSNDSSALRLGTLDNQGAAMTSPSGAWSASRTIGRHMRSIGRNGANMAMAGGFTGVVLRSTDAGSSWTSSVAFPTGDYVFDIDHAPGSSDVWVAVGGKGSISSTTNALTSAPAAPTWNDHRAALLAAGWPAGSHIDGVAVINSSTWMVAGDGGRIAKTTTSGASWSTFTIPGIAYIKDIKAIDANNLYAAGSNSAILKTTLGGNNAGQWTTYTHPWCGCWWEDLSIADSTHIYVVSTGTVVSRFDGTGWASSIEMPERTFATYSISSPSTASNIVYVGTSMGKVFKSIDSGLNFTRQDGPGYGVLMDVNAVSGTDVMATGAADLVVGTTTGGTSWNTLYEDATRRSIEAIDWAPSDGQKAMAVGGRGSILRTTDSGTSWTTQTSNTTANLNGIVWISSTRAVAVGSGGAAVTTADGGLTWSARTTGSSAELIDVAAGINGNVWAVGTGGTILHSRNYGDSWSAETSGTTYSLESVTAWGTQTAVAGGMNGTLLRTGDGGTTWSTVAGLPAWENAVGIVATSATNVWVATRFQGMYRSTDAGATIAPVATFPGLGVDAMDAIDSTIVTTDRWGVVQVSRDNGATWGQENGWTGSDFNAVAEIAAADSHTYLSADDLGGIRQEDEASAAAAQIPDYSGATNFTSGQTTGTFGVCLQSVASATQWAGWTPDGGTCTAVDTDPWKAVPTAPATVASATQGTTGTATFVFGMAVKAAQTPMNYRAGIVFETVAPAA